MCTHQGAPFVGAQLESILNQTHPPDEVVIGDDASTDGTLDVVRGMARRLAQDGGVAVQIIESSVRRGYRKNFERVVAACSGDIIFLADQDDVWFPEKIGSMLLHFSDDVAIVHCDALLTDGRLRSKGETIFGRHPVLGNLEDCLPTTRSFGIPGCTLAFRADLTETIVPFSELWGHDLWIVLVAGALGSISPVPEPLMLYRRHPHGSGPSRYLDGGWLNRGRQGARTRRPEDYERDLRKWEEVVERLEEASALGCGDPSGDRLEVSLAEYRRRLDLARFRDALRRWPRWKRLVPVTRRVVAGDYGRYLRAVWSPLKDVFL